MSNERSSSYCSQKFTSLSIDIEKRLSYSCCIALPEKIDLDWLTANPGKLFATPQLQQDRVDMLTGVKPHSCSPCWKSEDQDLVSRRTQMQTHVPLQIAQDVKTPKLLNLNLGSTCNLTCSYCCKQYSSAWRKDLLDNGSYVKYYNRYELLPADLIFDKISQQEYMNSHAYQVIEKEIATLGKVDTIDITGGEPFLYNHFPDLLNSFSPDQRIVFSTGLGVNTNRLERQVQRIKRKDKILIQVSAENCYDHYEFNRFGNSYSTFLENLQILIDHEFQIRFTSTLSNLTVFGFLQFAKRFQDHDIVCYFCTDPDFLSVHVLDEHSKNSLINSLASSGIAQADNIIRYLQQPCSQLQKQNFGAYIKEFALRRNLSLDIFPSTMLQWLNTSEEAHVVQ